MNETVKFIAELFGILGGAVTSIFIVWRFTLRVSKKFDLIDLLRKEVHNGSITTAMNHTANTDRFEKIGEQLTEVREDQIRIKMKLHMD